MTFSTNNFASQLDQRKLAERLTLNAAVFYMDWEDIQVQGQEPTGAFEFIANAAAAEITGIEFELFARPTDRWYLSLGLTLLDTELTEDQAFQLPAGRKGDPIPKVPETALSGNIEYTLPINANFDTVFRAFYSYTGESDTFFNSDFPGFAEIGRLKANVEIKGGLIFVHCGIDCRDRDRLDRPAKNWRKRKVSFAPRKRLGKKFDIVLFGVEIA